VSALRREAIEKTLKLSPLVVPALLCNFLLVSVEIPLLALTETHAKLLDTLHLAAHLFDYPATIITLCWSVFSLLSPTSESARRFSDSVLP
jgi:hypothetical protein